MIAGLALVSTSLVITDYLWQIARAGQRREQHVQSRHRTAQTNAPAAAVPMPEGPSGRAPTNHE